MSTKNKNTMQTTLTFAYDAEETRGCDIPSVQITATVLTWWPNAEDWPVIINSARNGGRDAKLTADEIEDVKNLARWYAEDEKVENSEKS